MHSAAATPSIRAAVLVAHPDDETLWAGGLILRRPRWQWYVATLCRASDPDRAPRFRQALEALAAEGGMGNLDDGPEQRPLGEDAIRDTLLALLAAKQPFDLVVTHGPRGEYTRHRRHEETSAAVIRLWNQGAIAARHLWTFAFRDDGRGGLPQAAGDAHLSCRLPASIWQRKYAIITEVYGFLPASFEARAAPETEAFYCFDRPIDAESFLSASGGPP
jgi:LmbE family N-acetylglucosaminyl deacetylase